MTRRAPFLLALLGALLVLAAGAWAQVGGGFDLTWSTVDGGGGTAQGSAFTVDGTLGQADAGALSGGPFTLAGGIWPGVEPTVPSSPVTLFVSRVTVGQASTVRVVVTDGCGAWPTFFGGGPSAL
jgi:hypothetical protein